MIRLRAYWRAYFALWLLTLFGALCFSAGILAGAEMGVVMLKAARP